MGGSLLRQFLGENSGCKVCTVKERCLPAFAATCGFQRATVMVPGVNAGFHSKGRGGLSGVATWQRDVTKGPRQLCLEDAIPDESRKERRLQFGINNDMLEEILSSFDMGCLCQEVPTDCKIHHAAKELLQKARRVQPADELSCIVIFVDGSFDPKKLTAAWAVAAFDFVSPEDIAWIGCMTGCLHERQFEGRLSAYTAELLGQLVANLICASRANTNVVVAYDATSAAGAAAGDFATKHEQQLAGNAVAAGALARSKGNYITQVHVASHNGQPGNELVDCLASHACESGCSTNSPHPEVLNAILHENVLDWMWLLCERGGVTHPDIQCDGSFHSTAASSVARVPWSCPADLQLAVGKQRADCESSFLCLRLVTYNTLSLLTPGQSSTLEREMRRLQIHVLGLQECREDTEAIKFHNGICKIAGPANAGHLGCQVWIDCENVRKALPIFLMGPRFCGRKKAFSLLYGSPRILIVGAGWQAEVCACCCSRLHCDLQRYA